MRDQNKRRKAPRFSGEPFVRRGALQAVEAFQRVKDKAAEVVKENAPKVREAVVEAIDTAKVHAGEALEGAQAHAAEAKQKVEEVARKGRISTRQAIAEGKERFTLFQWYCHQLDKRPLMTKALTTAGVGAAGDLLAQATLSSDPYNPRRTFSMAATGLALSGPLMHGWYGILNARIAGQSLPRIGQRIALDQGLFTPFMTPVSLASILMFQGQRDIGTKVRSVYWPTVSASWLCWVPAQAVNFAIVPAQFQVLFVNGVSLFWSMYLAVSMPKT